MHHRDRRQRVEFNELEGARSTSCCARPASSTNWLPKADLGRLVAVTDDARSALVHRALNDSAPDITTRIRHAIALFRGRDTTVESKRSAIVTLARITEERRALIKDQIGKPDEGALFEIANRYGLRHRKADQRGDYDEAFLDWIFWWYLATVELTNRLIASRTPG